MRIAVFRVPFRFFSVIRDFNVKSDIDIYPNLQHKLKLGVNYTYHIFRPYTVNVRASDATFDNDSLNRKYARDLAIYIQDDYDIIKKLKLNVGLRGVMFS